MCAINGQKVIKNKGYMPSKKNGYTIPEPPEDKRQLYIKGCSCGWCYECRRKNANQWRVRLKEEVKANQFKNMIFITFTFSEESYSKLAKEVRGDKIKEYGEVEGDIDNDIAAKAIRYWSEEIRHKHKRQPRRWLITERGGQNTERLHIHGIIFTNLSNDTILESWKFGKADDGRSTGRAGWVNEQTVNYITKYVFKTDSKHIDFKGRVFTSGGIGKAYIEDKLNKYRHRFQGEKTNTTYTDSQGYTCGLPKYYRDRLYTEEERRALWTIQLNKNEGKEIIDGVEYDENDVKTIKQAIKNNELKNIELGYPNTKQLEAIKEINKKRREIVWHHKTIKELKKANKSYRHIINEREKQKLVLKILKINNKKLLDKKNYVPLRRQYDKELFKT